MLFGLILCCAKPASDHLKPKKNYTKRYIFVTIVASLSSAFALLTFKTNRYGSISLHNSRLRRARRRNSDRADKQYTSTELCQAGDAEYGSQARDFFVSFCFDGGWTFGRTRRFGFSRSIFQLLVSMWRYNTGRLKPPSVF